MARSRLKLAVLALGRTRGRGGVTGCWQIRLLSAMQAPVKQATLMSQKNNWRLPPAICCPHTLSIRVASIVSASIRAWRPVQNTLLSTSISLPNSLSQVHRAACTRPIAHLFQRGRRYRENSESGREKKKLKGEDGLFFPFGPVMSRVSCERGSLADSVDVVVLCTHACVGR